ncbi:MAG: hypothetical protein OEY86_09920 [Nitrospira sp.]|nr:hypothetical protein [Nitrospira sp.]
MPTLNRDELSSFLPHAGAMRLIDGVESWDEVTIRCRAQSHRDGANPLRAHGRLDAVTGLEYAAQVMGVHVGLLAGAQSANPSIGFVGGLRDVAFGRDYLDDCLEDLVIDATQLFADDRSFLYQFVISSGEQMVLKGRASIFLQQAPV